MRTLLARCLIVFSLIWSAQSLAATDSELQAVDIKSLPNNRLRLNLILNKAPKKHPLSFSINKPSRIIIDLPGVHQHLNPEDLHKVINIGNLQRYEVVEANGRTRVILTLNRPTKYRIENLGKRVYINLAGSKLSRRENMKEHYSSISSSHLKHSVRKINFRGMPKQGGKVIIDLSDANMPIDLFPRGKDLVIDFYKTHMPRNLRRRLDVVDFGSPVSYVDATQKGRNAEVIIRGSDQYEHYAYQIDKHFVVELHPLTDAQKNELKKRKEVYTGKRISLNFQNIKVRAVLQLLADFTGINLVVSDTVTGDITLRLNNIPWDHAMDIILKTRGLDKREMGSVILIAPAQEIAAREKRELESMREAQELAPLRSQLLQVNYAKATDVAKLLKAQGNSLLSSRGNVSVDERTNTLWIQDTGKQLGVIEELVRKLDIPVKQVLIEARVVIVNKDFERDIGVRFGVTRPNHFSGTLEGANRINGGTDPVTFDDDTLPQRLNVNLPSLPTSGTPATLAIALAKLGKDILLDLELSALEVEGEAEIVSSPRIITANQQAAVIESGEEIPYQEATASGATAVAFKKAVLSLKVTPQITPDSKIILNLQVNQDTPDFINQVLGVPPILTREIQTNVLVSNGQTIVLGGIYKRDKTLDVKRVPFLGTLPIIGALFRNKAEKTAHEELLIFITPKIVEQSFATT